MGAVGEAAAGVTVRPLRVGFILPGTGLPRTGGERNLDALLQGFDRRKLVPVAIVRAGEIRAHLEARGIEVVEVPALVPAGVAGWLRYAALAVELGAGVSALLAGGSADPSRAVAAIAALCREAARLDGRFLPAGFRPARDAVLLPLHAARLHRALARARVDRCVADLSWDAAAAGLALRGGSTELVWFVQSSRPPGIGDTLARRLASRIVACGRAVGEVRVGARARYELVANGVDAARFAPAAAGAPRPSALAGLPEGTVLVGSSGALHADKGTDVLVRAAAPLLRARPELHVVLAGEVLPRYQTQLDALLRDSGLPGRFHRLGWVADVAELLPHLALYVLPSRFEGLPLGLCEAMACGVACIASDIPGCREVAEGGGVRLVPAGDPGALGAAIAELLDDRDARGRLAERGRRTVLERYTFDRSLREMERLLVER